MGTQRTYPNNRRLKRSWLNLIDDSVTGRLDSAKLWLHIGNIFASYKFLQMPADKMTSDMFATYLAIITMGHAGMYWLKNRGVDNGVSNTAMEQQDTDNDNSDDGCQQRTNAPLCGQNLRCNTCAESQQAATIEK